MNLRQKKSHKMKITKEYLGAWNSDPCFVGGEYRDIAGRGRQWIVTGVNTLTSYVVVAGQKWPVLTTWNGTIALCDSGRYGVGLSEVGLKASIANKRVVIGGGR